MRARRCGGGGVAAVWTLVSLVALSGVVSLAVDWGRVQVVKSELCAAADAAARAGASVASTTSSSDAIRAAAVAAAGYNSADGSPVALSPSADVEVGAWDETSHTFTPGGWTFNAVRVRARRTAQSGNAVPLMFGKLVGREASDVTVYAVAAYTVAPQPSYATNKSNPWLAGMPAGTTANGYDAAPVAAPTVLSTALTAGVPLTFDVTGKTSNQLGVEQEYEPDGNPNWVIHNYAGAEHGIADLHAPISSLVAVFLDDSQPDATAAPASLDFTDPLSRDFATLSPALKQPFFIGDGRRLNGEVQQFVVPPGATRLYVGSMDGQQWSDNAGGFSVTLHGAPQVSIHTVQ